LRLASLPIEAEAINVVVLRFEHMKVGLSE